MIQHLYVILSHLVYKITSQLVANDGRSALKWPSLICIFLTRCCVWFLHHFHCDLPLSVMYIQDNGSAETALILLPGAVRRYFPLKEFQCLHLWRSYTCDLSNNRSSEVVVSDRYLTTFQETAIREIAILRFWSGSKIHSGEFPGQVVFTLSPWGMENFPNSNVSEQNVLMSLLNFYFILISNERKQKKLQLFVKINFFSGYSPVWADLNDITKLSKMGMQTCNVQNKSDKRL